MSLPLSHLLLKGSWVDQALFVLANPCLLFPITKYSTCLGVVFERIYTISLSSKSVKKKKTSSTFLSWTGGLLQSLPWYHPSWFILWSTLVSTQVPCFHNVLSVLPEMLEPFPLDYFPFTSSKCLRAKRQIHTVAIQSLGGHLRSEKQHQYHPKCKLHKNPK